MNVVPRAIRTRLATAGLAPALAPLLAGAWLLVALSAWMGCATAKAAAPDATPGGSPALRIAVSNSVLSLPLWVAEDEGLLEAHRARVKLVGCVGGQHCMQMLTAHDVDAATSTELPVMFNAFERGGFAIVATFVASTRDVKIVSRPDRAVRGAADLVGRTVATVAGTSAHYYLDSYLLFHGVDPRSVRIVSMAPDALGDALQAGRVDAVAVWEPFAHRARRAGGLALPAARLYTETFNLVVDASRLRARPEDVVAVLRALDAAQRLIAERPARAQEILRRRLALDEAFVSDTWREFEFRLGLDQSLIGTLEGVARWALREGHVRSGRTMPSFLDFVEPGPLRAVRPEAVTLVK